MYVLDLFSGIGGFSLGLERAGMMTVAFCEKDKHCHAVLRKHWPKTPIFDDVSKISGHGIVNSLGRIDIICGGFPCQDISFAGSRSGISENTRSGLWKEYLRIIEEVRPKYVIVENVEYLRKNGLGIVLNDLARIGYDAEWSCITADSVGYPHQRKRLFIISYPSSKRLNRCIIKNRSLFINEQWENSQTYYQGKECLSKSIEICPILSRGAFEAFRDTGAKKRETVSELCRVTNGIPEGLDERRRKQRVKQLGNSIIPDIAEIIGRSIWIDMKNSPTQNPK